MEITTDLVKHLANLSRIYFTESEVESFKNEFSLTLKQIDELNEVDTENVEVFNNSVNARNLREDKVLDGLKIEEVVLNAPKKLNGAIIVPKVVE